MRVFNGENCKRTIQIRVNYTDDLLLNVSWVLKFVVDTEIRETALARTAKDVPLWLCLGQVADSERIRAWDGIGAKLLACDLHGVQLNPTDILAQLGSAGLTSVFCEGGSALAATLLAHDLVDELVGFTAGLTIGAEGMPALGALGVGRLEDAPRFQLVDSRSVGPDILHRWRRAHS